MEMRTGALVPALPLEAKGVELAKAWRRKVAGGFDFILPVEMSAGPIKEHIHTGDKADNERNTWLEGKRR